MVDEEDLGSAAKPCKRKCSDMLPPERTCDEPYERVTEEEDESGSA